MATIQHEDIADPKIHEPKGVSTASNNTVYVANGSGSGTWKQVPVDAVDEATILQDVEDGIGDGSISWDGIWYQTIVIDDISTASSVLVPVIDDATFVQAYMVLGGAITVADASVSFKNSAGSSMGTAVTVAYTSSAKGDDYTFTATSNNTLTGPTYIEVATDGGSTTTMPLYVTLQFTINQVKTS